MIVITADAASDDGREGAAGGGTRRGFQADGSNPEWERQPVVPVVPVVPVQVESGRPVWKWSRGED